ncbi:hypothetical protein KUF83_38805 [Streptomyces sp. BV286]|uniref:hypothetical protein n=1 Tax=Streptomyces sp. BV286 TaxID=2849672 RepID=UPI001C2E9727|nr:hypothetical protein [Streptomyces sp. BV286]MBV1942441.1 hypothetical protein [Streptomyces sp. BV286]
MAQKSPAPVASSRWAPATDQLPRDLGELAGPVCGVVTLPLHLAWSGLQTFDLGDEKLLLGMYRIVLLNGRHEDYTRYLDAAVLAGRWPVLRKMLGRGVRSAWEDRFPRLRSAAAA